MLTKAVSANEAAYARPRPPEVCPRAPIFPGFYDKALAKFGARAVS